MIRIPRIGRRRAPSPLVLVDGSNVRRSAWPNPDPASLVDALERWMAATRPSERAVVVFDGAVEAGSGAQVIVVAVPYADDELVTIAAREVAAGSRVLAATSDRELRRRLEQSGAEVAWGGGGFLRELGLGPGRGRTRR